MGTLTGIVAGVDYFIKPKTLLPFIKNGSTLQAEVALIYAERSLWKDGMVMQMDIRKLTLDSDNDGRTDIEELKFNTDPLSADTDKDGIPDGDDCNPTYKNVENKYSVLYRHLLEDSGRDSIVFFKPKKPTKVRTLKLILNGPCIVLTEDSAYMHLSGAEYTYIMMNWDEYLAYRKKVGAPMATTQISPLFPVNNMPGHYRVCIIERRGSTYYLVVEKKDHWIVTRLDD